MSRNEIDRDRILSDTIILYIHSEDGKHKYTRNCHK